MAEGKKEQVKNCLVIDDTAPYLVDEIAAQEMLGSAGRYFSSSVPLSSDKVLALFE